MFREYKIIVLIIKNILDHQGSEKYKFCICILGRWIQAAMLCNRRRGDYFDINAAWCHCATR